MSLTLNKKLRTLSQDPGVYLFRNANHEVIYVGKAKNLRKRVRSYFSKGSLAPDKERMITEIADVECMIVHSETEAFLLETSMIKKYRPQYNIVLKDDRNFSYIKVTVQKSFPRVLVVRKILADGSKYFGPFLSTASVYETLRVLRKTFPFRTCAVMPKQPCPEYHMGRCVAPCAFEEGRKQYAKIIAQVCVFLRGNDREIRKSLQQQMYDAAAREEYEKAARFRDQIEAIARVTAKQHVISLHADSQDIVSVAQAGTVAAVHIFFVRQGRVSGQAQFILEHVEGAKESQLLEAFLAQYYTQVAELPKEIVISHPVRLPHFQIPLTLPQRGHKRQLLLMGQKNALAFAKQTRDSEEISERQARQSLQELVQIFHLSHSPRRIEVYDISNIQGYEAVGSMIVFVNGKPRKDQYRKFKIRTLDRPNDFAMLKEVLFRRFKRHRDDWELPDLILIDGGKGQLSSGIEVLNTLGVQVPVAALAKREEELFLPRNSHKQFLQERDDGNFTLCRLPKDSAALLLLRRMRDEAHRFAIEFYRKRHRTVLTRSTLDEIPGIGPKRKKMLLQRFGSMQDIVTASDTELAKLIGVQATRSLRGIV